MNQNRGLRFLPMAIIILVIIVVIAGLISLGRAVFSGGDSSGDTTEQSAARTSLLKTDLSRSVAMVVRGPIIAQEEFTSYKIQVSADERSMIVYKGYLDDVRRQKIMGNNTRAYEQFVHSLDKANMTQERRGDISDDLRGICASGYVYEFSVRRDDETIGLFWTSTCSGSQGNLGASRDQLSELFQNQIPNYSDIAPFGSYPRIGSF